MASLHARLRPWWLALPLVCACGDNAAPQGSADAAPRPDGAPGVDAPAVVADAAPPDAVERGPVTITVIGNDGLPDADAHVLFYDDADTLVEDVAVDGAGGASVDLLRGGFAVILGVINNRATVLADLDPGDEITYRAPRFYPTIDVNWTVPTYLGATAYRIHDISGQVEGPGPVVVKPTWSVPTTNVAAVATAGGLPLASLPAQDVAIFDGATPTLTGDWVEASTTTVTLAGVPAGWTSNGSVSSVSTGVTSVDGPAFVAGVATGPVLDLGDDRAMARVSLAEPGAFGQQIVLRYLARGGAHTVDVADHVLPWFTSATWDMSARTFTVVFPDAVPQVDMLYVTLFANDGSGRSWEIYGRRADGFALPDLPAAYDAMDLGMASVFISGPSLYRTDDATLAAAVRAAPVNAWFSSVHAVGTTVTLLSPGS
ncbi:MAG: hypothetical protein R2939_03490 [Kofleriaceae bacterium]